MYTDQKERGGKLRWVVVISVSVEQVGEAGYAQHATHTTLRCGRVEEKEGSFVAGWMAGWLGVGGGGGGAGGEEGRKEGRDVRWPRFALCPAGG